MKNFYLSIIVALFFTLSVSNTDAQVNIGDSMALVDLYNSTNGPSWNRKTNWLSSKPVKTWHGVGVKNNRVDSLDLPSNRMDGVLTESFGNLSKLRTANFYSNRLKGALPQSFGNLTELTFLNFSVNKFTAIPPTIGNCKKLVTFAMTSNLLTNIPPSMLQCKNLVSLMLALNQISGNLPPQISKLSNLVMLDLYYNQFTGNIPSELASLTKLKTLNLGANKFSGEIPSQLGNLINMIDLTLTGNLLTGSIPSSFASMMSNAGRFYFGYNQLSGLLPMQSTASEAYVNVNGNNYNFDALEPGVSYYPKMNAPGNGINQNLLPLHQNGNILSVYAGGTLSNNTYFWYKNNAPVKTKIGDSTFTPSSPGAYRVSIENAFCGFYSRLGSTTITVTSVPNFTGNKIRIAVSPNPASSIINITLKQNAMQDGTVYIYDAMGSLVKSQSFVQQTKISINISSLRQGHYRVVVNSNGIIAEGNFLKE